MQMCPLCNSNTNIIFVGKYKLEHCSSCGVRYHTPLPSAQAIKTWYSKHGLAKRWRGDIRFAIKENYRKNKDNYPYYLSLVQDYLDAGKCVLDLGCYAGHFLTHLCKRGMLGFGVDINQGLVDYGNNEFHELFGLQLYCGDLASLSFDKNKFYVITCHQVLEHLIDPAGFLDAVYTLLSPNGVFSLSVPDAENNFKISYPEHLFHFTKKSLEISLIKAGFSPTIFSREKQNALFATCTKR